MPTIDTTSSHPQKVSSNFKQHDPWIDFDDCECIRETDKACLIWFDELSKPEWIPKSHISSDSEVWKDGQRGKLIISGWIASQKSLLDGSTKTNTKPEANSKLELVEPYKLYRQLARKYHPDVNPEPWAVQVMSDITTLWHEILKATGKR